MTRIGIVGLSVHSEAFTVIVNSQNGDPDLAGSRIVVLYEAPVNKDVEFSDKQIRRFKTTVLNHGVEMVESMEVLLDKSDAIMILTNDGRPHLEQTIPVLRAGKPVFIDKPMSDSFTGVKAIFKASEEYQAPIFSSSPLRYGDGFQSDIKAGSVGEVLGAETYGPAPIQESHVDLFWDGIHGVELLYTIMGQGCLSVQQMEKIDEDVVFGIWENGKTGVFRGLRNGKAGFGGKAFGTDSIAYMGKFGGYKPLVEEILTFFRSGISPVKNEETIEIYAFMEAAKRSKESNGLTIKMKDILES